MEVPRIERTGLLSALLWVLLYITIPLAVVAGSILSFTKDPSGCLSGFLTLKKASSKWVLFFYFCCIKVSNRSCTIFYAPVALNDPARFHSRPQRPRRQHYFLSSLLAHVQGMIVHSTVLPRVKVGVLL
ncbi:hypothetical protein BCR43DRAFT_491082 [Syncephalastrum racemosum]|uniref:Uncharacterized protein n=1 Tax=Syncephalastrum racemosum TaxID=13706 RepID=A0A1X2GZ92_SYNRA|nr:hypothetical protein BCR43DRAFT_500120 [Syncephalastrum racemosum]ORY89237.1 hypothetical protein BCR43DRAFT_500123 [Syncephalastrum racemosum]ORY89244.1 hypothetical protein BCR43DRAFT_500135 [Syncephalastrum racemosum]ORY98240.1 hypothetical protein BCR43DRAFT_491082 [Syncephalastrum racemosum]